MGKRAKIFNESKELFLHGSANGWLRISDESGKEVTLRPDFMKKDDTPTQFYNLGKFVKDE